MTVVVERTLALSPPEEAPPILGLVAHPIRWRLLRELVHSDRAVWELTQLLGERQSLVSYHLSQLRAAGLVQTRRSAADGRDSYYTVDLSHCGQQLRAAGGALHPALSFGSPSSMPRSHRRSRRRWRVLFLCTGNSARSQLAEALLHQLSEGAIDVASAGSNPKPLHPNAVRVMSRRGIDISQNRTKHLDQFVSQRFDLVITLCDRVREVCPEFPSHPDLVHWSMADPAAEDPVLKDPAPETMGGRRRRSSLPAFERAAAELDRRIAFLIQSLNQPPTRRSTHA